MTVAKKILFIGLFSLIVFGNVCVVFAESVWQSGKYVPPIELRTIDNSDPAQLMERLKQYIITGEKMADQFEVSLRFYKRLAERYVSITSGCLNNDVFNTPLFIDADLQSVCNKKRQEELRLQLKKQASQLDGLEYELEIVKRKVGKASGLVLEMTQFKELKDKLNKMDEKVRESKETKQRLEDLENQK